MKKTIIIILLCLSQTGQAQLFSKEKVANRINFDQKFLSWGFFLGFNSYDFKFDYQQNLEDILVQRTAGFQVGLIGDMRINDFFNLRLEPGVHFTTRTLNYNPSYFAGTQFDNNDLVREVKSAYIHLPLLIKASTKRINNFKPFIIGGVSTAINLSANEDNPDDNRVEQFRMTSNNFFYEIGFGIDFYTQYFKFSPSIRGVFGFNDELVRDADPNSPWTGNIAQMNTRAIFINFTFQ